MKITTLLTLLIVSLSAMAKLPTPPDGKRWVLNAQYSDEFNGKQLDATKWNNTFDGWKGRRPAWFNPEAVSVGDGYLKIRSGVLDEAFNGYSIYGGAVQSTTTNASYGYYECHFKASQLPMSTTFWLSNPKTILEEEDQKCSNGSYPKYSQELDIQECVGQVTSTQSWCQTFDQAMHSNTHFRIIKCGESKETFYTRGANTKLDNKVNADFNTYGCWWVDDKHAMFYANDAYFETVAFKDDFTSTPFSRPMRINMVTETYDWNPCTKETHASVLEDMSMNTSYYDWIRSWYLVDVDAAINYSGEMPLEDQISFHRAPSFYNSSRQLKLRYEYEAKVDRLLKIKLLDKDKNVVENLEKSLYAGYGRVKYEQFQTHNNFGGNGPYTVVVEMVDVENGEVLSSISADLGDIVASAKAVNDHKVHCYVNAKRQLVFSHIEKACSVKLYSMNGHLLQSKTLQANTTLDLSALMQGNYIVSYNASNTKVFIP